MKRVGADEDDERFGEVDGKDDVWDNENESRCDAGMLWILTKHNSVNKQITNQMFQKKKISKIIRKQKEIRTYGTLNIDYRTCKFVIVFLICLIHQYDI